MFERRAQLLDALQNGFHHRPVLVVGDLILDRYLWGEVSRISPEAPVPVVRVRRETEGCGGAANVALNLANLGIRPRLAGWIGSDGEGRRLREILGLAGVDTALVRALAGRPTITKTRVIGGHQQMLRLDREETGPFPRSAQETFLHNIIRQFQASPRPEVIILSDYGKGALTESICQGVIEAARAEKIPVIVDPKGLDYEKYRRATALTPNRRELAEAVRAPIDDLDRLLVAGETLRAGLEADFLAVTLSEQGIALLEGETPFRRLPAMAREVYDVSGAGDTVVAALAAGLAAGLTRLDALHLANLAAGVVVAKVGTTPVNRTELLAAFDSEEALEQSDKIRPLEQAGIQVETWRQRGDRVVFTNGCFDLLHAGHVTYLEQARHLGDRLVVGLNTDASVRALKGPTRPVIQQADRARVLAAMASVDLVVLFDEATPMNLIRTLRPEILAKGADYTEDQVVGGEAVRSWGGRVALVPLVAGRRSSHIMEHIKRT